MSEAGKINYIELPAKDLNQVKRFYNELFGWPFTDYGPEYTAFSDSGLEGGFYLADRRNRVSDGSALVVLYSDNLEREKQKILNEGAEISVDIFSFPGGRRFHFLDPNGNELAIWSEK